MGLPTCTVCSHPERETIDDALRSGATLRSVAAQFGMSPSTLSRHGHHDREAKPALVLHESATTSTRKFSALGQAGARIEELTGILGKVGQFGAQSQNARLVLAAAKSELDVLIKISDRLPQSPEAIFAEGRDRTLSAVAQALRSSVPDRELLARVIAAVNSELIAQGVEDPAEVA